MVFIGYENGVLRLRFDDFKSNEIKSLDYNSGKLNISNDSGYYYSLSFSNLSLAKMVFLDNITKNIRILNQDNLSFFSASGSDWSIGTSGNDTFYTNNNGERIFGGAGDDTYIVKQSGKDTIITDNSGINTLIFEDFKLQDVIVEGSVNGLEIKYINNEKLIIDGSIQNLKFYNNVNLTMDQFLLNKDVVFNGTNDSETISGFLSNDTIYGGLGDDTLNGNSGNDKLYGGVGSDILNGGVGDDKFFFNKGDGVDYINDFSGNNQIILTDIKSSEIYYSFDKGMLNINYGESDVIKIKNFLANNRDNFSIKFADGVVVTNANFDSEVGVQYWIRNLVGSTNSSVDFKYAFPTVIPSYLTNPNEISTWSALGDSAKNYILSRFDQLSGSTGLNFTETSNLSQQNVITVQRNAQSDSSGYAYFPTSSYIGSDIFFNIDYASDPLKSWQKYVFPHEVGHALGLIHSFEGFKANLFSETEESTKWTVMSYNTIDYTDGDYKPFDFAALQAMYGINQTSRSGNDTYQFDSTTGVLIWDGTGNDSIDASNSSLKAYINLNSGAWSYLGEKSQYISSVNQLAINLSTVIENAIGTNLDDTLIGNQFDNNLDGRNGDDTLIGNWGDDTLLGQAGNDKLIGGIGSDTLIGGLGDDVYYIDSLDSIVEKTGEGVDTVVAEFSYTLNISDNLENLTLSGLLNIDGVGNSSNNKIVGNGGNNTLDAGAGDDILIGGLGQDILIGGLGNDVYYVDLLDLIIEGDDGGLDTIVSGSNYTLNNYKNVENLILSGSLNISGVGDIGNNTLTGNNGDNVLDGAAGNDILIGGFGLDVLIGGLGDDSYYIDNIGDKIIEKNDEGFDRIFSKVSYILDNDGSVESLILINSDDVNAKGNDFDNILIGNVGDNKLNGGEGNDVLDGGLGVDVLIGGFGDDSYYVDNNNDEIIEEVNQGADRVFSTINYFLDGTNTLEKLVLLGGDNINGFGNDLNNILTGNSANNILDGAAGNDILIGGLGADTLVGGVGNDVYYIDSLDIIVEKEDEGIETVVVGFSYSLDSSQYVENLNLSGNSNISGIGNSINNIITGNNGDNILDGGLGNDVLIGGLGNDVLVGGLGNDSYYIDSVLDKVVEKNNGGYDRIFSQVNYIMDTGNFVESLILIDSKNINAKGNEFDNIIIGNVGNNILDGGQSNDTVNGGAGNDILIGGAGNDIVIFNLVNNANNLAGNDFDTWYDFTIGDTLLNLNADKIDVSSLLIGYTKDQSLDAYLELYTQNGDTTLSIDRDGTQSTYTSENLLLLSKVNIDLITLLDNHQLIV